MRRGECSNNQTTMSIPRNMNDTFCIHSQLAVDFTQLIFVVLEITRAKQRVFFHFVMRVRPFLKYIHYYDDSL